MQKEVDTHSKKIDWGVIAVPALILTVMIAVILAASLVTLTVLTAKLTGMLLGVLFLPFFGSALVPPEVSSLNEKHKKTLKSIEKEFKEEQEEAMKELDARITELHFLDCDIKSESVPIKEAYLNGTKSSASKSGFFKTEDDNTQQPANQSKLQSEKTIVPVLCRQG
ncbi:MAG: hypothetical protein ACHP6H_06390 [Legionellales bacterium]